jgi:hypothetical protein
VPATFTPNNNGVVELTLSQAVNGVSSGTVEGYVNAALSTVTAGIDYDQTMYVLPGKVAFNGAAAYAYMNGNRAVFWNTYSSTLLVLVHELGHNLNALHSGFDGSSCKLLVVVDVLFAL